MVANLFLALLSSLAPSPQGSEFQVTLLANEGFFLQSEGQAVLIDAFVEEAYSIYDALHPDLASAILLRRAPFDEVTLALVSHAHPDHFQPKMTGKFLIRYPEAVLATSGEVIENLKVGFNRFDTVSDRIKKFWPEPETSTAYVHDDVAVEFLRLPHGGAWPDMQNLGHVITVGTAKILHIGDAAVDPAIFAPYKLPKRELDVALVPYWFLQTDDGLALLKDHVQAKHYIACHISPPELQRLKKRLPKKLENTQVLSPMETAVFQAAARRQEIPHPEGAPR